MAAVKKRYVLFQDMLGEIDEAYALMHEYDTQLHDYNGVILYQAESQLIKLIGDFPGISAVECASKQKKTMSACSQLIKKLRTKGFIRQERNELNNRVYNLYLTDEGKEIYRNHRKFEETCYRRTYRLLDSCTEEEFNAFIKIQKLINKGFQQDVEDGKVLVLEGK